MSTLSNWKMDEALLPDERPIPGTQTPIPCHSSAPDAPPPYTNPTQVPSHSGMPYSQCYPPPTAGMGYSQLYSPPPGGQPYYPSPGVVYPGPPVVNYPPQQQQHHQQQVVVVNNQPMGVGPVVIRASVSMAGATVLSCFVFWCCGCLFGGIAFILAMVGSCKASDDDAIGAIRLRNASYGFSIVGIVCGIVTTAVIIGLGISSGQIHS